LFVVKVNAGVLVGIAIVLSNVKLPCNVSTTAAVFVQVTGVLKVRDLIVPVAAMLKIVARPPVFVTYTFGTKVAPGVNAILPDPPRYKFVDPKRVLNSNVFAVEVLPVTYIFVIFDVKPAVDVNKDPVPVRYRWGQVRVFVPVAAVIVPVSISTLESEALTIPLVRVRVLPVGSLNESLRTNVPLTLLNVADPENRVPLQNIQPPVLAAEPAKVVVPV
jgi:hypothetical protein